MEECQGKEGIESPSYELLGGKTGGLVMVVGSPHLCFCLGGSDFEMVGEAKTWVYGRWG